MEGQRTPGEAPSAVPSEVFGHVVYSSVGTHHEVYARSRRTSGQPWRPVSGPRPPLLYAAARSSSPVPRDSQPPRLHTNSAVPIKRSATPFMRSTSGVSPCCSLSHRDRTPRRPSSMSGPASPSEHSSIRVRGRSASRPAGGPSRWPPRSVSPRALPHGSSATRPFGLPCAVCGCRGNALDIGSPVPIRPISAKKKTRSTDRAGHDAAHVGAGLWR